jgi:hypothetical protein
MAIKSLLVTIPAITGYYRDFPRAWRWAQVGLKAYRSLANDIVHRTMTIEDKHCTYLCQLEHYIVILTHGSVLPRYSCYFNLSRPENDPLGIENVRSFNILDLKIITWIFGMRSIVGKNIRSEERRIGFTVEPSIGILSHHTVQTQSLDLYLSIIFWKLGVHRNIILKLILDIVAMKMRIGFICLRIRTSGVLL